MSMVISSPDMGPIFEALELPAPESHNGSLKINRRRARGEYVEVSVDAERVIPPCMKGFLRVNEEATLDFFARLQEENDGEFPQEQLVAAFEEELDPFRGQIEFNGSGAFRGDKLLKYRRSELL